MTIRVYQPSFCAKMAQLFYDDTVYTVNAKIIRRHNWVRGTQDGLTLKSSIAGFGGH